MTDRKTPIKVSQKFNFTTVQIWKAITEADQMKQWFFEDIQEFRPVEGFYTEFAVEAHDKTFIHKWKIVEVIPERKIVYDWSYEKYPGQGIVTFELFDVEGGCVLELTNTGLDSFPEDMPEFSRDSCLEGWRYFIQSRLPEYLNKT